MKLNVIIPVERAFGLVESAPILYNAGEYNVITHRISKGRVSNGSAFFIINELLITAIYHRFLISIKTCGILNIYQVNKPQILLWSCKYILISGYPIK